LEKGLRFTAVNGEGQELAHRQRAGTMWTWVSEKSTPMKPEVISIDTSQVKARRSAAGPNSWALRTHRVFRARGGGEHRRGHQGFATHAARAQTALPSTPNAPAKYG
jgi:hypothetical protein